MTASRPRRRLLLPLVGTTLLTALGGGGWAAHHFGWLSKSGDGAVANEQLESGFADAGREDLAGQLASAWSDEPAPTQQPPTAGSAIADQTPNYNPYASNPNSLDSDSVVPTDTLDVMAGLPELDSRLTVDPLAAPTADLTEVDNTMDPLSASLESLGEPTVARGQSPEVQLAPANENPLRQPLARADSTGARRAFDGETVAYNAPPEPTPNTVVENPLRRTPVATPAQALSTNAEAAWQTEVVPGSDDPLAVDPLGGGLDALPAMTDITATAHDQPNTATLEADPPLELEPVEATPLSRADAPRTRFEAPAAEVASRTPTPAMPQEFANFGDDNPLRTTDSSSKQGSLEPSSAGFGRPGERALEGPQRAALVMQKFAPDEIQVGKECKFIIKVRNMGQRPADDVVIRDQVPQGTKLVTTTPQADGEQDALAWHLGTLSPGEERTMELTLLPLEEGEIGSVATVTAVTQASTKTKCTRPQLALRMTAPGQVMIGRQQRVTIELHNPGTGDASGVMLLENVPENVRHEAGPALEFEVGTLRAGETRRLELVLTAERAGKVRNVMSARADGNLQVQQHVDFEVISPALTVDVEGPTRRYLERPATYTVKVDNPGSAPAQDVQLITQLPRGMKFVKANNLGEYDPNTHSVYWSLAELPAGQTGSVEFVTMPMEPGEHTLEIKSRAREGLEDQTTRQVSVEGLPAIMFEVRDLNDPIEVGGKTDYEIRVVNQGTKASTNVSVRVVTPPGMRVVSAQGETRHQIDAQGVVFEPLGRLAPKADTLFRVQLQGAKAGDQRVLVEVNTDDLTQPVRKEESTRVFGDE